MIINEIINGHTTISLSINENSALYYWSYSLTLSYKLVLTFLIGKKTKNCDWLEYGEL